MSLSLEKAQAQVRRVATSAALVGVVLLLIQSALIVADGLARWLFSTPIHGMEDISSQMITVIVVSFFPAVLIERRNIRVTIVGRFLPPRGAAWLDVFGHVVLFAFVLIVAWQFAAYAVETRQQTTLILQLPTAPAMFVAAAILIACAAIEGLVLAAEVATALRDTTDTAK